MLPIAFISADKKEIESFVDSYIKSNKLRSHQVFHIQPSDKEISIDQIRMIKKITSFTHSEKLLFIIYDFHRASIEAQNASLKILEEKTSKTHFILIYENESAMIPTIASRVKLIHDKKQEGVNLKKQEEAKKILQLIETKGMAILGENAVTGIKKDEAINFIDSVITYFHKEPLKNYAHIPILKRAIQLRGLLTYNNINTQLVIDNLLIFITKQIKIES